MVSRRYDIEGFKKGGLYSHAVEAGGFIFVSGVLPIDYDENTGTTDNIGKATETAIGNIKKILEAAGSDLGKVVKVTVFLRDIADFAQMNEAYAKFFSTDPPARTCVAVKEIPGGFPLEVEVIATK